MSRNIRWTGRLTQSVGTGGGERDPLLASCVTPGDVVFVSAHMTATLAPPDLLTAVAEPTRLRIVNCLAAAPLFVSDLQAILDLPQPTVSRHLRVLRDNDLVRDTPIGQFVLYRLRRGTDPSGRLLTAILEAMTHDDTLGRERTIAASRSRNHTRLRMEGESRDAER